MNTCGTCMHRGNPIVVQDEHGIDAPTRFFICFLHKHDERVSRRFHVNPPPDVNAIIMHDEYVVDYKEPFVVDGSGYFAALCVPEDFGCNRWEQTP